MHRGGGIFVKILIVMFLLLVIGGGLIYVYRQDIAGYAMMTITERHATAIGLNQQDQADIMPQFQYLADQVAAGGLSGEQVKAVLGDFSVEPAAGVMVIVGLTRQHLAVLPADQRAAAEMTAQRYAHAISASGQPGQTPVDRATIDQLGMIAANYDDQQGWQLKPVLSQQEIEECLRIMSAEADRVGIAATVSEIDLASIVHRDLAKVMAAKGISTDQLPPPPATPAAP